ncbi:MAG: carbohydrate ABC transporter permease [Spirochaetia bacterium]|nr:carbohydrate ABC transporter permease [Spirochaetia bacterium]
MKINKSISVFFRLMVVVLLTLFFVYPFWWMIVNSLNNPSDIFGKPSFFPKAWRFVNYVDIFKVQPFGKHFLNTIIVAGFGTIGNILLSSLSGYAFARLNFKGRNFFFILLLMALMMPIEVIIIPLYTQMSTMHLTDSFFPLILIPIFCSQGAFSAFMFRQHYITVPKELEEAATLDGLSTIKIFMKIMMPISIPIVASAGILAFLSVWNMYLEPLVFISSLDKFTLPLSLANFNDSYGLPQWHLQLAATTLSVVPIMLIYLSFQEKITNAMVNSGLK